jgi:hypothetical protein
MKNQFLKYLELFAKLVLTSFLLSLLAIIFVFITKQNEFKIPGLFDDYLLNVYNGGISPNFAIGGNLSLKDVTFYAFLITFVTFIINRFVSKRH